MRRVLQALEQRAVIASKVEVDALITEARENIQIYIEDNASLLNLKKAVRVLRQTSNTLLIMQIHGGVLLCNEIIKVIESLLEGKIDLLEEAQDVISSAIVRLDGYLEYVEAGHKDIPLVLMPLLNDLRASRGDVLISESVLFFPNIDGVPSPEIISNKKEEATSVWVSIIRSNYQKTLLACVNEKDISTPAAQLCKLLIRLQRASDTQEAQKIWWLGSALAQAVAINAVEFNASIASLFSALDKQIKTLVEYGEKNFINQIDESLVRNILYYVAISDSRGRIVNQVKEAFALNEQVPQQNELDDLDRLISAPSGEVLITVSKALIEDIAAAKDCIELYLHSNKSEAQYIEKLFSGLKKISDTLAMIGIDEYTTKVESQIQEASLILQGQHEDIDLGLLGISEVVLEIETCINNFIEYRINFSDSNKLQTSSNIESVSSEHEVAYKIALSEILLKLEQVKELLSEMIKVSFDDNQYNLVIHNIKEISGVLDITENSIPSQLLKGIENYLLSKQFQDDIKQNNGRISNLADCVVSLQCYFEQIHDQVPYANQILEYGSFALQALDKVSEEILQEPITQGEKDSQVDIDFSSSLMEETSDVRSSHAEFSVDEEYSMDQLTKDIDSLPDINVDVKHSGEIESIDNHVEVCIQESSQNKDSDKELVMLSENAESALVQTFIEEAEEAIHSMKKNWQTWRMNQDDWESFTNMRRGFHTLKGSGRLVGAEILAEFSWEYENLCNKCLGTKDPISKNTQLIIQQGIKTGYKLIKQLKNPFTDYEFELDKLIDQVQQTSHNIIEQQQSDAANLDLQEESLDTLQDELTSIFAKEAGQHVLVMQEAINQGKNISFDTLIEQDLLRTLHTIAGSAQTAGVTQVSDLCRGLENVVSTVVKNQVALEVNQEKFIRETVKQLKDDLQKLENIVPLSEPDESLLDSLDKLNKELLENLADNEKQSDNLNDEISKPSMVDVHSSVDQELSEIFFEEAEDALSSCQSAIQKLKSNNQNIEALSELRRQFHTLKGSSRMAGYFTIGELSHISENLLVSMVDNKVALNDLTLSILQNVIDNIHTNIDAAHKGQNIFLDDALVNKILLVSDNKYDEVISKTIDKEKVSNKLVENNTAKQSEFEVNAVPPVEIEISNLANDDEVSKHTTSSETERENLIEFKAEDKITNKARREVVRVQAEVLDGLVNDAGEVSIQRSHLDQLFESFNQNASEFEQTIGRIRERLRELEMETEAQILFKHSEEQQNTPEFDPLEMDRYSNIQQLSRSLAESMDDLQNIKDTFLNQMQEGEDVLIRQKVLTSHLQDNLLRIRMVKFNTIEQRLQRIVRQTSSELSKNVELVIEGGEIEIDRRVLNGILSSIEHILRNSIGHGIESPQIRKQSDKPEQGKIVIQIGREGSEIKLVIEDDGSGIDVDKIRAKAVENDLIKKNEELTEGQILQLIFKSGLSTADKVTKVAGRGVGMDVVDKDVRHLGGNVEIQSNKGKGAKFILHLPFTLAVSQVLLVKAAKETYALTLSGIEGVVQIPTNELKEIYSNEQASYVYAGQDYKLHNLASLLQGGEVYLDNTISTYPVILVRLGEQQLALQVDTSLGNKEIVVKPLASHLINAQGVSGATVMGDGKVALIIDMSWIARLTQVQSKNNLTLSDSRQSNEEPTIMVVDDSITIRKVTTRFLERNNFKVVTAKDGVDALQKLQNFIPKVVLLDIEMPRMDGYELATQIRKDERLSEVPIVMITSRTGNKHRNRALDIGVNGYLGKPYNESQLLDRINAM
ncbi:MAG: Hpt domain-containing protein [Pseudomonadota bacterium]